MITVHRLENNSRSQIYLDEKRQHFTKKCQQVFDLLMSGKELTVEGALVDHRVSSLPRRIKDLKESGVCLSDKWRDGVKVYFMSDGDRQFNK